MNREASLAPGCKNLVGLLRYRAQVQADECAFSFLRDGEEEEARITYAGLDRRARAVAAELQSLGASGERILILHPSGLDFVCAFFGCLFSGGIAVPAHPPIGKRHRERFSSILKNSQPKFALTSAAILERSRRNFPELREENGILGIDSIRASEQPAEGWSEIDPSPDSLALLQYTSGSIGEPKGVMVDHGNLMNNQEVIKNAFGHSETTVVLGWLPLFHDMGLLGNILGSVYAGATCYLMSPAAFLQRPIRWLRAISKYKVTTSGGPNFAYDSCVFEVPAAEREGLDLSGWKVAYNGSEAIRAETLDRFSSAYEFCGFSPNSFYPCYGLAEATLFVAGGSHGQAPAIHHFSKESLETNFVQSASPENSRAISLVGCGSSWFEDRISIRRPNSLAPCGPDEVGEICLSGPSVAKGYWNRPEESRKTFCHEGENNGQILRTGDLGFVFQGNLFVAGRLKDLIIIRGRNLFPQDIESVASACHPAFQSDGCAAFSVDSGSRETLIIVQEIRREFLSANLDNPIAAIRSGVLKALEVNPNAIVLTKPGAIPRTTSGKIRRKACRDLFLQSGLPVVAETESPGDFESAESALESFDGRALPGPEQIEEFLKRQLAGLLKIDPDLLDGRARLSENGIDSLHSIRFQYAIEKVFGLQMPIGLMQEMSPGELSETLFKRSGKPGENRSSGVPELEEGAVRGGDTGPFPLNKLQQAYWAGRHREHELGNVAAHIYFEYESRNCDLERLTAAWNRLIRRHDALRTVVRSDGRQEVLNDVPHYEIEITDLRDCDAEVAEDQLKVVRRHMSHRLFPLDRWPFFEIRAQRLPGNRTRFHLSFDSFIVDGASIWLLMREWGMLFLDRNEDLRKLDFSFREYVSRELCLEDSEPWKRSMTYWWERIRSLPRAPLLPLAKNPGDISNPRFVRRTARLSAPEWGQLKTRGKSAGITPSAILLSAFVEVLRLWSEEASFSVNVTQFNRLPFHRDAEHIVGQLASFCLLGVSDSPEDDCFEKRAIRIQQQLWEVLDHRYVSGVTVLREFRNGRSNAPEPAAPIVFTSLLQDTAEMGWLGEMVYCVTQTPQVFLDHQVYEQDGSLVLAWDFISELFPAGLIPSMFDACHRFLIRLCEDDAAWREASPDLMPKRELENREASNRMVSPIPEVLLQSMFVEQARGHPERKAVICGDKVLSYDDLIRWSNKLGRRLRVLGAHPGDPIAIVMEKGPEQIVAVIGVLLAGAPLLPINPDLPAGRLKQLLENRDSKIILTQPRLRKSCPWPDGMRILCIDDDEILACEDSPLAPVQSPEDIAYIIYTSGSTGTPKGAAITHRGIINALDCTNREFAVGPNDRVLSLTALHHDMSVFDVFGILSAGGTIVLPDAALALDPSHWVELLENERVTIWNSVPTILDILVDHLERKKTPVSLALRLGFIGGDWIPLSLPRRVRSLLPFAKLVSVGGPTETTLWNIWYPISEIEPDWKSIPYGRPIPNTQYYILNDRMEHCPDWVKGKMYCGGIGLAQGYWNDREGTDARFLSHPRFGRLYRTGDLGRFLPDGNVEILGREDFQVKINGNRIEPGEIESALSKHSSVRGAVVMPAVEKHGAARLVAYVISNAPRVGEKELRGFLGKQVPSHMVPSSFVFLDKFPLNSNNKIDRSALPEPGHAPERECALDGAFQGDTGKQIQRIIEKILNVSSVPADTDLESLGATSVDIIRIATQLEETFGYRPRIDEFVTLSTAGRIRDYYQKDRETAAKPDSPDQTKLLTDPDERGEFRKSEPGIRLFPEETPVVDLVIGEDDSEGTDRRSHRNFGPDPIEFSQICQFLQCLRRIPGNGDRLKNPYPSGGGLYAVQAYLYIKPDRIDGLPEGLYYYHPHHHHLLQLTSEPILDRRIHWPSNRSIFDDSAFSLFLVARLDAIRAMYGDESPRFAALEAGIISQLLETSARRAGIGICNIGQVDFDSIRSAFRIEAGDDLIHSMVGGCPVDGKRGDAACLEPGRESSQDGDLSVPMKFGEPENCLEIAVESLSQKANDAFDLSFASPKRKPAEAEPRVFLTGASGFLGAFLLNELCDQSNAKIYCLVRSGSEAAGLERIERNLRRYKVTRADFGSRIVPVPGDLSKPRLGLSESNFESLSAKVDIIIHSAARVNWVEPFGALEPANIHGTLEMLRFAVTGKVKPFHFVSSLAVFPFSGEAVSEQDSLEFDGSLYGGYAQSKWVAEKMVSLAAERELPTVIYRPGIITGHSSNGVFNTNSYLENMIKGCIQLGSAPRLDSAVDMTPVDVVGRAIARLSKSEESLGKVFHLANPRPASMDWLIDSLRSFGYDLSVLGFEEWKNELLSSPSFSVNALSPFAAFLAGLTEGRARMPRHSCDSTTAILSREAVELPPVDDELLSVYLSHFLESGFLKPPTTLPGT